MQEISRPITEGPLAGQTHELVGLRLTVPLYTDDYAREYAAWSEQYGLAWTLENLDAIQVQPKTPPPPDMPVFTYERRGDEWRAAS